MEVSPRTMAASRAVPFAAESSRLARSRERVHVLSGFVVATAFDLLQDDPLQVGRHLVPKTWCFQ